MGTNKESRFAEVMVDKLLLESFPNERSAYYKADDEKTKGAALAKFRGRLRWHIRNSLSRRQKEVLQCYLSGKKEREIARDLNITQQVVNIYKHRAIKKLQKLLAL